MTLKNMVIISTFSASLVVPGLPFSNLTMNDADARNHTNGVSTTSNSNSGGSLGGGSRSSSSSSHSKSSSSGCCSGSGDSRSTRTRNNTQTANNQSGDAANSGQARRRWFQFWKPRNKEVGSMDLGSGRVKGVGSLDLGSGR